MIVSEQLAIDHGLKKNEYKKWNQNWETIRMVIIFSILIFGFVFIYSQIDKVLEILTNTTSK